MLRDRYVPAVLTVIAVLFALNLFKPSDRPLATIESAAVAQSDTRLYPGSPTIERPAANLRVAAIGGQQVAGLKDVVALGDGKTFVVSNAGGFLVYQVEPVNQPARN